MDGWHVLLATVVLWLVGTIIILKRHIDKQEKNFSRLNSVCMDQAARISRISGLLVANQRELIEARGTLDVQHHQLSVFMQKERSEQNEAFSRATSGVTIRLPELSERAAFLRKIAAERDPQEKLTSMMVFADWLDEHGEHDLAAAYRWAGQNDRYPNQVVGGYRWYEENSSMPVRHRLPGAIYEWLLSATSPTQDRAFVVLGVAMRSAGFSGPGQPSS